MNACDEHCNCTTTSMRVHELGSLADRMMIAASGHPPEQSPGVQHCRPDRVVARIRIVGALPAQTDAPEIVFPAMVAMRERFGELLFTQYGFRDGFNPSLTIPIPVRMGRVDPVHGWVAGDHPGIDQGPIIAMLENHRSGLIWRTMRRNEYVVYGLRRAGFTGG